ncbi:MAG: hypothetical protein H7239_11210 [Flavobacterium sp.]|nr:hypothetical protein [Flavobacterium sp.]
MKKISNCVIFLIIISAFLYSCKKNEPQVKTTESVNNSVATSSKTSTNDSLNGEYCFLKAENKDTTTVKIRVLSADDVRGEMVLAPWEKDGAVGTLSGKLISKNEMELLYNYMIEGNRQTETKIMKIENNKLFIKQGELVDPKNDGNLIFKNKDKATYKIVLDKITCD